MFIEFFGLSMIKAGITLAYIIFSILVFYGGFQVWNCVDDRWRYRQALVTKNMHQTVFILGRLVGAGLVFFSIQAASLRSMLSGDRWEFWVQKGVFALVFGLFLITVLVVLFLAYDRAVSWFDMGVAMNGKAQGVLREVRHGKSLYVIAWNTAFWLVACIAASLISVSGIRATLPGF